MTRFNTSFEYEASLQGSDLKFQKMYETWKYFFYLSPNVSTVRERKQKRNKGKNVDMKEGEDCQPCERLEVTW